MIFSGAWFFSASYWRHFGLRCRIININKVNIMNTYNVRYYDKGDYSVKEVVIQYDPYTALASSLTMNNGYVNWGNVTLLSMEIVSRV